MRSTLLFYLFAMSSAFGQGMASFQQDNFSGVHGVYLNPGSIADSYWKAHLNVGLGSFQSSEKRLPQETILLSRHVMKFGGSRYGVTQNELRGPGLMVQLRNNHAFAITSRYRASESIQGNYELVSWLRRDVSQAPPSANSISLDNNAFSEYAVSYAAPLYEKGKHFLKAGATFKLIRGWQTSSINSQGNITENSDKSLAYNFTNFEAQHSDLGFTSDLDISRILSGKTPGNGNGFDIGVIYEFRPEPDAHQYLLNNKTRSDTEKTRYKVKAGISIMDIGKIKYGQIQTYANSGIAQLYQNDYEDLSSSDQLRAQLFSDFGLEGKAQNGSATVNLPQALSIQADVNLGKGWYAGGVFTAPKNPSKTNLSTSVQVAAGPRYEANDFGFAVIGQYYSTIGVASLGANLRLGVFTIGTENLLGFFKKNRLNPQAYVGFFIPLGRWKRESDRDGDNVSDRLDQCPDLPGLWAFRGCPDTDKDGVEDRLDKCPEEAGPLETNGCPDADGDGIFDKNDACPNEAGTAKFNGCPDSDGDGVSNAEDECPDVPGLAELSGCPDSDGDGLKDNQDKCPQAAGLKDLEGCPLAILPKTNQQDSSERELIKALSKAFESNPVIPDSTNKLLQNWLSDHSTGKLSLIFSGSDQELLLRIAGYYKDELTSSLGDRIAVSIIMTSGQAPGISIELVP